MQTVENQYDIDKIIKHFPKQLKLFRQKAKLTTQEVSNCLGKTPSTISIWENGKALPSIETILKICNLYHIDDINELINYSEECESQAPQALNKLNRTEQNLIKLWRDSKPHVRAGITTLLKECSKV